MLLLTGTPIVNYIFDLYGQVHFLDAAEWPSFAHFLEDFYFPGYQIVTSSQVIGEVRNLQVLRQRLNSIMVRRPKAVLKLPPKDREIIDVDVADAGFWSTIAEQGKLLAKLQWRLMSLLDDPAIDPSRDEIRALQEQIAGITSEVRYQVRMNKLPGAIEYLRSCAGKTLVFAHHRDVVAALVDALRDRGVACFTGGSPLKDRDIAATRFQNDWNCQFFIGNIEAAGQGITLTAAKHVVFAETDWRGTYLEQAEDRAHRIGQTDPVLVTYLLLRPIMWSTDSWMQTKTSEKQAVIDAVLGAASEDNSVRARMAQYDWNRQARSEG